MRKQPTTLAIAALALGGLGVGSLPAQAAQIDNAITSVSSSGDAKVGEAVQLTAQWKVPDFSKAGDTFTLSLPAELIPLASSFPILDDQGNVVANAVAANGQVVVTLTDFVNTHPINVHGTLNFSVRISINATVGEPITVNWGGQTTVITPKGWANPVGKITKPHKFGWATSGGEVGWGFDIPGQLDNVVLNDLPKDVKLRCESLYVSEGDQTNGAPSTWTTLSPSQYDVVCDENGFTLKVNQIAQDHVIRVVIRSTPTAGLSEVTNTWSLTANQGPAEGVATSPVYSADGTGAGESPAP